MRVKGSPSVPNCYFSSRLSKVFMVKSPVQWNLNYKKNICEVPAGHWKCRYETQTHFKPAGGRKVFKTLSGDAEYFVLGEISDLESISTLQITPTKESYSCIQTICAISKMTEWSLFILKANQSISQ